jgi:RNA polymerase sigma-70 factor (ECF subfamily)
MDPAPGSHQFQTTLWNVVLSAKDRSDPGSEAALEVLCRAYWYPLYAYARRSRLAPDAAEDAIQELFGRLLERDFLKNVSPEKGKFRSFLLASLNHLLTELHARDQAIKRGGGIRFVSLDEEPAEDRYHKEPANELSPDRLYDRRCALTLLEKALTLLEADYAAAAQAAVFAELRPLLLPRSAEESYVAIGGRLGLSEGAVKMQVSRLRHRFQIKFRAAVAATVADPSQIDEEIQHLLSALAG